MLRQILLTAHLLAAMAWIGGMFFAYFCLRPAAGEVLDPPKRVPLMAATFARFLPAAAASVAIILVTGFAMLAAIGFGAAPVGLHAMMGIGLVMTGVFVYVYAALWPTVRNASAAAQWPVAGQALGRIRWAVALNLALGVCAVIAAVSAR
jgi:uncharacterized membrane protein